MKNSNTAQQWLSFAEEDFSVAKTGSRKKQKRYETLCFLAQQSAEKSLKAILIKMDKSFPKTHNIERLLLLLKEEELNIPHIIQKATFLTNYATDTRYPGDYDPVDRNEYKQALKHAENVLKWAKKIIEKKSDEFF